MANEPELTIEFMPGTENAGADLLSRPTSGQREKDTSRPCPMVNQVSIWDEIWEEHLKGHGGVFKTYYALKRKGSRATRKMVQEVCDICEVCAQFRNQCSRAPYGQPLFSLDPGHTVFGDIIGPLPRGKGGAMYIHCMVDSATRLGDAMRMRDTSAASNLRAFQHWIRKNGPFKVLVTDNVAYYTSEEMMSWCKANEVDHKFIAPYRHE